MTRSAERRERMLATALAVLLLLATIGEGGSAPTALVVWHGLLVAVLAVAWLAPPDASRPWPSGVMWALGAFLLLFTVGWARAPYAYGALLTALELGASLAVGWLAWLAGPRLIERVALPLVGAGAVHGLFVAGQRLVSGATRPAGTFLNPNHLALWLVAALLVFAGAEFGRSGGARLWTLLLVAPAFCGLLLARSRGALFALLAGGTVLLAGHWRDLSPRARRSALALFALALTIAAASALARLDDYDPFRYHRVRIWQASIASWLDSPWWGSGPGGFEDAAARFRFPDGEGPLQYDQVHSTSHSDPLRLLAELGAPAALALSLAVLFAAGRLVSAYRSGRVSYASKGAVAALVAIGVQGLVDNASRTAALYVLAAALWGAVLAATSDREPVERASPPRVSFVWRTGLAALLVFLFIAADVAPYLAWRTASALPRGLLDAGQLHRLERAMRLNPLHAGYPARFAEHVAAGPLTVEAYGLGREAAERAVRLDPATAATWLALARVESAACAQRERTNLCRERTQAAYTAAEQRSPYEAAIAVETAMFLLDTGDGPAARARAERALALEPESVLPRLVLADALLEEGKAEAAHEAARLVDEAEAKARRWSDWSHRRLLRLDVEALARLRQRLGHERAL